MFLELCKCLFCRAVMLFFRVKVWRGESIALTHVSSLTDSGLAVLNIWWLCAIDRHSIGT